MTLNEYGKYEAVLSDITKNGNKGLGIDY